MPSQQIIDELWETDWKACKLAFPFSSCLALFAASSVFMPFLLKGQVFMKLVGFHAVRRFSETSGRKMNSHKKQLWDKLNDQERSVEWTVSRFFLTPSMLVQCPSTSKVSQVKLCWLSTAIRDTGSRPFIFAGSWITRSLVSVWWLLRAIALHPGPQPWVYRWMTPQYSMFTCG